MSIKEFCLKHFILVHSIILLFVVATSISLVSFNIMGDIPSWTLTFLIPAWGGYGLFVELVNAWTNDRLAELIMNSVDLDGVDLSGK